MIGKGVHRLGRSIAPRANGQGRSAANGTGNHPPSAIEKSIFALAGRPSKVEQLGSLDDEEPGSPARSHLSKCEVQSRLRVDGDA
jgi:hypothetical protein